jgi:hypothetical protein
MKVLNADFSFSFSVNLNNISIDLCRASVSGRDVQGINQLIKSFNVEPESSLGYKNKQKINLFKIINLILSF